MNMWFFKTDPRPPRPGEVSIVIAGVYENEGADKGKTWEHAEKWAPAELPVHCPRCGRKDSTYEAVEGVEAEYGTEYYICLGCDYDWCASYMPGGYYGFEKTRQRTGKIERTRSP